MFQRLKEVNLQQIYGKWYRETGVFRCFFRSTNFVSLKHFPDFELPPVCFESPLLTRLVDEVANHDWQNTLFMIDLPGELAVTAAFLLGKYHQLKPVLTFNNILHPFGLVGSQQYISSLLQCGEMLEEYQPKGFVLVLDQLRYGEYDAAALRQFFNNQYEITDYDVPALEMLQALNYEKVVYLYQNAVKEDIDLYLQYLMDGNFSVLRVKIGT